MPFAGEWNIQELEMRHLLEQEMFVVTAAIREGFQRAQVPLQNLTAMENTATMLQGTTNEIADLRLEGDHGPQFWAEFMLQVERDIANGRTFPFGKTAFEYYFPFYQAGFQHNSNDPTSITAESYNDANYYYEPANIPTYEDAELTHLSQSAGTTFRNFNWRSITNNRRFYEDGDGNRPSTTYNVNNYQTSPAWQYFQSRAAAYYRVYDNVSGHGFGNIELGRLQAANGFHSNSFLDYTDRYRGYTNRFSAYGASRTASTSDYNLRLSGSGATATSDHIREFLYNNNFLEANRFDPIDFARFADMSITGSFATGSGLNYQNIYDALGPTTSTPPGCGVLDSNGFVVNLGAVNNMTLTDVSDPQLTTMLRMIKRYLQDRQYRLRVLVIINIQEQISIYIPSV